MTINNVFRNLFKVFLFLFLFSIFVQIPIPLVEKASFYYIFLILMVGTGLAYIKHIPRTLLLSTSLVLLLTNLGVSFIYGIVEFGFRIDNIRYFILLMSLLGGVITYYVIDRSTLDRILFNVGVLVLLVIIARLVLYSNDFVNLIISGRKALSDSYPMLVAGGHNIEVTYLLLLAAMMYKRTLFLILFSIGILYSFLYESRAGILIGIMILLYRNNLFQLSLKNALVLVFGVFFVGAWLLLSDGGISSRFLDVDREIRYGELGIGRIGFFYGAYEMLSNSFYPAGIGNAVYLMSEYTGVVYKENNVHNIYLQYLLDSGVTACILLAVLSVGLVNKAINYQSKFLPGIVVIVFFVIGLIQFTGYDALNWFFIGYFLAHLKKEKSKYLKVYKV